jgi:BarA-like signal transduction histidine kinase
VDGLKEGIENGVPGNLRENAEMAWQIQQRWAHSKPIARERLHPTYLAHADRSHNGTKPKNTIALQK